MKERKKKNCNGICKEVSNVRVRVNRKKKKNIIERREKIVYGKAASLEYSDLMNILKRHSYGRKVIVVGFHYFDIQVTCASFFLNWGGNTADFKGEDGERTLR